MLSTLPDWLRVLNFTLASVAMFNLIRFRVKCSPLPKWERDQWVIWVVISGTVITLALDGILRHVPVTPRSLFTTVIASTLVYGVFVKKLWVCDRLNEENMDEDLH